MWAPPRRSGQLDAFELKAMLEKICARAFTADQVLLLDPPLATVPITAPMLPQISDLIAKYDTDGDHLINLEEWKSLAYDAEALGKISRTMAGDNFID